MPSRSLRPMLRLTRTAGPLLLVSLVVACVGGSAALTREEFVAQANAICAAGDAKIQAAAPAMSGEQMPSAEELEAFYGDIVAVSQEIIDELDALVPPEELRAEMESLITDARAVMDEIKTQDTATFFAAEEDPFAAVNARALAMGLTACGQSGGEEQ